MDESAKRSPILRALPWNYTLASGWHAATKMGDFRVKYLELSRYTGWVWYLSNGNRDDETYRYVDSDVEGVDAAEAFYRDRCSEFLPVAGPDDVVVPRKLAQSARAVFEALYKAAAHKWEVSIAPRKDGADLWRADYDAMTAILDTDRAEARRGD